ncbi:hypothetical protein ABBQ38_008099 [Trebouxia sp. C0009 RCD-2024]
MQEVSWVQDNRICGLKGYCSQLVDELENHDRRATDAFEDLQEDRDVMRSRFEAQKDAWEKQALEMQGKLVLLEDQVHNLKGESKGNGIVILELEAQVVSERDARTEAERQLKEEKERMIIELREQQEASDMRTLEVQQKLALAKDRIYDLQAGRKEDAIVILELEAQVAAVEEAHSESESSQVLEDSARVTQENEVSTPGGRRYAPAPVPASPGPPMSVLHKRTLEVQEKLAQAEQLEPQASEDAGIIDDFSSITLENENSQ